MESLIATEYGNNDIFFILSLLYDDSNWGDKQINQDHIFPEDMFDYQKMTANGQGEQWSKYYTLRNRVANLELLTQQENQEKLDKPFDKWIASRDRSFLTRHLIPDDPELWKFENFESFIEARERLIVDRLFGLFGSTGKEE